MCLPEPNAVDISRVAASAPGSSALISVDLPMPDWPTSTEALPISHGRSRDTSCFADNSITVYPMARWGASMARAVARCSAMSHLLSTITTRN